MRLELPDTFNLALVQEDPTVGSLDHNADIIIKRWKSCRLNAPNLVAFPELFLSGYPVQDLVLKPSFIQECSKKVNDIIAVCRDGPAVGFGAPCIVDDKLHNSYVIAKDGVEIARILKHKLPNSEVFDECRQFQPGPICGPVQIGPARIGFPICEDAWTEDVCETLAESGAEILVVVNGSPYFRNKLDIRLVKMVSRLVETELPIAYLNMVGGQDDLIFDGASFVLNPGGELVLQMSPFEKSAETVQFIRHGNGWKAEKRRLALIPDEWEQDYRAMVESVKGFVRKCGFSKVLVGLSGGIDSALVATIAADSLGPENLRCIMLPSRFTSKSSICDATKVAANLGCRLDTIKIDLLQETVDKQLGDIFANMSQDLTEENIQSRLRGLLLMAVSNKFGEMLLTTGNKSEAAVGYATIYGDMAGAYNPVKDLYKTRVYGVSKWRNRCHRPWMKCPAKVCIPDTIINKQPSAELRPNQRDSDSLPPYDELDQILEILIDQDRSIQDAVLAGFELEKVKKIEQLIYGSEHKRFQSAPGVKLTRRALWLDRRYPIVNHWREDTES